MTPGFCYYISLMGKNLSNGWISMVHAFESNSLLYLSTPVTLWSAVRNDKKPTREWAPRRMGPITENEPTVTQKKKQASEPSRPATHNRLEARCEREKFLSSSFVIHCLFEAHCTPPHQVGKDICPTIGIDLSDSWRTNTNRSMGPRLRSRW